jgi:sporulation protein YlmC with PRC-barrel domain
MVLPTERATGMKKSTKTGLCTLAASMSLIVSGAALAQSEQPQQQQQPRQEQQPRQQQQQQPSWADRGTERTQDRQGDHQQQPTDDADPLLDTPDVETGDVEEGMVPDGQHADHLHWSAGSLPYNRFHADDLVGSEVRSLQDEPIGEVSTLVFDEDGRILAAVVETGGELGLGGKAVAIPWQYVRPVQTGDNDYYLLVEIDPDSMDSAPEYDRD